MWRVRFCRLVLPAIMVQIATSLPAVAEDQLSTTGSVVFTNIQGSLSPEAEAAPYVGAGPGGKLGYIVQFGSIQPTTAPELAGSSLVFSGVQGPNPFFFGLPIHVIASKRGLIFCEWEADFTVDIVGEGTATFRGDGTFTVVGGTGRYWGASGEFQTLFETDVIPLSADVAVAEYTQEGTIYRH